MKGAAENRRDVGRIRGHVCLFGLRIDASVFLVPFVSILEKCAVEVMFVR